MSFLPYSVLSLRSPVAYFRFFYSLETFSFASFDFLVLVSFFTNSLMKRRGVSAFSTLSVWTVVYAACLKTGYIFFRYLACWRGINTWQSIISSFNTTRLRDVRKFGSQPLSSEFWINLFTRINMDTCSWLIKISMYWRNNVYFRPCHMLISRNSFNQYINKLSFYLQGKMCSQTHAILTLILHHFRFLLCQLILMSTCRHITKLSGFSHENFLWYSFLRNFLPVLVTSKFVNLTM